jgi:thiamine-phosphate pyrophosphorylase
LCISKRTSKYTFHDKRPLFYYITDRRQLTGLALSDCIRRALAWGVDFIQIREKDLAERELFDWTCRIAAMARGTGCRILVNGRADIALAAGAHGVHLPSSGLRPSDIRPWLPEDFLIGLSVHSINEVRDDFVQGADYVLAGPVFPTASKLRYGPPIGLKRLQQICSRARLPVFGLGGIHPEVIGSVLDSGASGIAGISIFQNNAQFKALRSSAVKSTIVNQK